MSPPSRSESFLPLPQQQQQQQQQQSQQHFRPWEIQSPTSASETWETPSHSASATTSDQQQPISPRTDLVPRRISAPPPPPRPGYEYILYRGQWVQSRSMAKLHNLSCEVRSPGSKSSSSSGSQTGEKKTRKALPAHVVAMFMTWLFDDDLYNLSYPFPTAEEKKMFMAGGVTESQVNGWFINARRRCIRDIIEELNKQGVPIKQHKHRHPPPGHDQRKKNLTFSNALRENSLYAQHRRAIEAVRATRRARSRSPKENALPSPKWEPIMC